MVTVISESRNEACLPVPELAMARVTSPDPLASKMSLSSKGPGS